MAAPRQVPSSALSTTAATMRLARRSRRTGCIGWCGNIRRSWGSRSARIRSAPRSPPMRSITRPTSPRSRSGWGTRIFRRRGSTTTARLGRRTARRSRLFISGGVDSTTYFCLRSSDNDPHPSVTNGGFADTSSNDNLAAHVRIFSRPLAPHRGRVGQQLAPAGDRRFGSPQCPRSSLAALPNILFPVGPLPARARKEPRVR
jgi:hypothetical protein